MQLASCAGPTATTQPPKGMQQGPPTIEHAIAFNTPSVARWTAVVTGAPGTSVAHYAVDWVAKGDAFRLNASLDSDLLQPGDTLTLSASLLNEEVPIRAFCSASVLMPAGAT